MENNKARKLIGVRWMGETGDLYDENTVYLFYADKTIIDKCGGKREFGSVELSRIEKGSRRIWQPVYGEEKESPTRRRWVKRVEGTGLDFLTGGVIYELFENSNPIHFPHYVIDDDGDRFGMNNPPQSNCWQEVDGPEEEKSATRFYKCIDDGGYDTLITIGKVYETTGELFHGFQTIVNDRGNNFYLNDVDIKMFEEVDGPEEEKSATRFYKCIDNSTRPSFEARLTVGKVYETTGETGGLSGSHIILCDKGETFYLNSCDIQLFEEVDGPGEETPAFETSYEAVTLSAMARDYQKECIEKISHLVDAISINPNPTKKKEETKMLTIQQNVTLINGIDSEHLSIENLLDRIKGENGHMERLDEYGVDSPAIGKLKAKHERNIKVLTKILEAKVADEVDDDNQDS